MVQSAVLNTKRLKVPILERYGSRSKTEKRTVKIKSYTLLTVRQFKGTVTVALAAKNGTVKNTENGAVLYGHGSGETFRPPTVPMFIRKKKGMTYLKWFSGVLRLCAFTLV